MQAVVAQNNLMQSTRYLDPELESPETLRFALKQKMPSNVANWEIQLRLNNLRIIYGNIVELVNSEMCSATYIKDMQEVYLRIKELESMLLISW